MKSALVTGAARRIGRAIALDLAEQGFDVAIHCQSSVNEAEKTAADVRRAGQRAVVVAADLSQAGEPERVLAEAAEDLGGLTLLVNNASVFEPDELHSVDIESWTSHLDVNLRAPVFLSQAFAAQLPAGEAGNIINIIDQRVWRLTPLFFSYTVSKSALWTVTQTMAQGLAPRIRVNAIGPGPALASRRMDADEFARQSQLTLLERGTTPDEICATIRYLLAQPAITGQMIALDGGQHLAWQTPDIVEIRE